MADSQIIQADRNNYSEYENVTKEYPMLKLKSNTKYKKKIKYINPDDYNKKLKIFSSDPILKIKTEELNIDYKGYQYIRFSIETFESEVIVRPTIKIYNETTDEIEEILRFVIDISK